MRVSFVKNLAIIALTFIAQSVKSQPPSKDYQLLFEDNW